MLSVTRSVLASLIIVGLVQGFSQKMPKPTANRAVAPAKEQAVSAAVSVRNVAAGLMMATGLLLSSDPALALTENTISNLPLTLIAARSGGRAGGRAYRAPASARPASSTTYRSTTIVRPMVASPPIIVSPGYGYGGYGYSSPFSGFGLGYGLGAINSAGDQMRDYRQDSEIQRDRVELEMEKQKSAELEARIKQLEMATK
ncbi:hypothetical protein MPSEU_001049400 [Mayamaea pseudoterrestris]|nr:hypothetical protein MPSEU_001049400 [Mayamaea pseudoterrestris]